MLHVLGIPPFDAICVSLKYSFHSFFCQSSSCPAQVTGIRSSPRQIGKVWETDPDPAAGNAPSGNPGNLLSKRLEMDSILTNVSRNSFLWMKSWLAGTLLKATYFSLAMKPNPLIDLKADEFAPSFPNDPLINSLQINESVNLLIRKCRSYRLCI